MKKIVIWKKKIDFKINNAKKNKIGIYVLQSHFKIVVEKERKK